MKPSLLDTLSKHQFLLTSVVIGLFLASSALFTTNYFKNQTAYVAAPCYFQSDVTAKEAELTNLQGQATSIQNEIYNLEQSISSSAGSSVTNSYNIDNLRAEIISDYAISQEEDRANTICTAESNGEATDPSCSDVRAYVTSIKTNNEYKKTTLANLEAQSGSNNTDYLTNTLAERKSTLANLNDVQIPELTQLIALYRADICPDTEQICDDGIDNDRDYDEGGGVDCGDADCGTSPACQVVVGGGSSGSGDPEVNNAADAGNPKPSDEPIINPDAKSPEHVPIDLPEAPLPTGDGDIQPGLFPEPPPDCQAYERELDQLSNKGSALEVEHDNIMQQILAKEAEADNNNMNNSSATYAVEAAYINDQLEALRAQATANAADQAQNATEIVSINTKIQECYAAR